jgi:hypothetical protein
MSRHDELRFRLGQAESALRTALAQPSRDAARVASLRRVAEDLRQRLQGAEAIGGR